MSALEGNFQYRAADIRAGLRVMLRGAFLFAIATLVALAALLTWSVSETGFWPLRDPVPLLIIVGGLGAVVWGLWGGPRRMSLAYERKFGGRDVTARFDEAGFELESPRRLFVRHEWEELERVRESPDVLLVHLSQDLPYIVPKRAFHPDDLERLRDLFRRRTRFG